MKWFVEHIKLIGLLIAGLALAIVGQQVVGKRLAKRASGLLEDDNADDKVAIAARQKVKTAVSKAIVAQDAAERAVNIARSEHKKAVKELAQSKPEGMDTADLLNYLNRGIR